MGKLLPAPTEEAGTAPPISIFDALSSKSDHNRAPRVAPLFAGEVRLADLRRVLAEQGHTAQLKGEGVLFCDGSISIQKVTDGEILMKGELSDLFHKIRRIVYSTLAAI